MTEWRRSAQEHLRWIQACLELGIDSFDHADIYGDYQAEALFGAALALDPSLRARIRLVSKCGIKLVSERRPAHRLKSYDTSDAHVRLSVENSLRALCTDHLDLLLIHRPDPLMDADALAETFRRLRAEGKVRHFGVSNHSPGQFALLHDRIDLAAHQIECSPLQLTAMHDGTLDQCQQLRITAMAWSPLGGGRLFADDDAQATRVRTQLARIGAKHGVSAASVAYAFVRRHPARPLPITGSGRIEALREAVAALTLDLSAEDWFAIREASCGQRVP